MPLFSRHKFHRLLLTAGLIAGVMLMTLGLMPRSSHMADQLTTASKTTLKSKLATLSKDEIREVEKAIHVQLGLRL